MNSPRKPLSVRMPRFLGDRRGTIAILSAAMLPVMAAAAALGVDLAAVHLDRRTAQSTIDLAAINAANNMDIAEEAARATLKANRLTNAKSLAVVKGNYVADPARAPADRFRPGQKPFNAVQVTLLKDTKTYFANIFLHDPLRLKVAATAQSMGEAAFSVGSRLAALRGGIANTLLDKLLGVNVELTVMDYEALIGAKVRIDQLLSQINGEANLQAATYDDVLDATVTLADIARAAAAVASNDGNNDAAKVLAIIGKTSSASLKVPLRQLIDAGPYGSATIGGAGSGLAATLSAFDILRAGSFIANGEHQLSLNLVGNVEGLVGLTLDLVIGERPQHSAWVTIGSQGAKVATAQLKMRLVAQVSGAPLLPVSLRLPIYAEAAYAEAELSDIRCSANASDQAVTVSVRPGIARAAIADVSDWQLASSQLYAPLADGTIVTTPLLSVKASALADLGSSSAQGLEFSQQDIDEGILKRTETHGFVQTLAQSLLGSARIRIAGLALTTSSLRTLLEPAAIAIDPVLSEVLETLGVSLGEADVAVHGLRCGNANLAG